MTTFNWSISQLDRHTSDGFVVTAHYNVLAVDGNYTSSTYGTTSFTQVEGETYIPYAELTEAVVVGWVQNALGQETVESSLQSQIEAQKNPVQEAGVPWAPTTNITPDMLT
jgi:hypothetical protein